METDLTVVDIELVGIFVLNQLQANLFDVFQSNSKQSCKASYKLWYWLALIIRRKIRWQQAAENNLLRAYRIVLSLHPPSNAFKYWNICNNYRPNWPIELKYLEYLWKSLMPVLTKLAIESPRYNPQWPPISLNNWSEKLILYQLFLLTLDRIQK